MDLRALTGYVALALLVGYWIWVLSCTAPELRRGTRDLPLRVRVLLVKTAALALTGLVVAVVHFWATHVWHVLVAVPLAAAAGAGLRRTYRRLVAAPRHRLPLGRRIRRSGHLDVIAQPRGRQAAHRVTGAAVPAPRLPIEPADQDPTFAAVRAAAEAQQLPATPPVPQQAAASPATQQAAASTATQQAAGPPATQQAADGPPPEPLAPAPPAAPHAANSWTVPIPRAAPDPGTAPVTPPAASTSSPVGPLLAGQAEGT